MAVKEACMRQNTQLAWEILEAEEDEWAEVTMAPPADEPRPARRQWLAKLLGSVALLATLTGVVGYRLVQDAEAGIAATPGRDFDPFNGDRYLRLSFAGSNETITKAIDRLDGFLKAFR